MVITQFDTMVYDFVFLKIRNGFMKKLVNILRTVELL